METKAQQAKAVVMDFLMSIIDSDPNHLFKNDDQIFDFGSKLIAYGKQITALSGHPISPEPHNLLLVKDEKLAMALRQVIAEYGKALAKHPVWPTNPVLAASIVSEECGELVQAANQYLWPAPGANGDLFPIHQEATQTAVTAIRMMLMVAKEIKQEEVQNVGN